MKASAEAPLAVNGPQHEVVARDLATIAAETAGLSVTAMDAHIFEAALKRRMRATGIGNASTYAALHCDRANEREAYLEEVLIGETSFFRDAAVFAEMTRWALAWTALHSRPMRILSAPCSTGEEPYSIAAALLEAGLPGSDFEIDAVDISALAIEHARAGVYSGFALRNVGSPERAGFLEADGSAWKVNDSVRKCVIFRRANLLDEDVLAGRTYDLIFARNLMIYQTAAARTSMARLLASALALDGRLVVGSADWGADLGEWFALEQPVQSFALRHRASSHQPVDAEITHAGPETHGSRLPAVMPARLAVPSLAGGDVPTAQSKDAAELARSALAAEARGESGTAEWICRQALYLDGSNLAALELLVRLERPRVSRRVHLALHARLHRLRASTTAGALR